MAISRFEHPLSASVDAPPELDQIVLDEVEPPVEPEVVTTKDDFESRVFMDRTAGIFYMVGAALSLATLTFPEWIGRETQALGILWALALIDGLFVWEKAGRLPVWFHHVNIAMLTLIISAGIVQNGVAGPAVAPFYLAGAVYSFFFFSRWAALAHMAWIAANYGFALRLLDDHVGISLTGWLMLVGMLVVTGGAVGWLVERMRTLADIEHDLKEEAEQSKVDAERANHAKSEFLSRMSHELRTPLNAVLGFAQVLEMDELDDDQSESVRQINKAGRHLLELINEVLDLSRIEAGRLSLSIEPVRWHETLEECLTLVSPLAAERGIKIETHLEAGADVHVRADSQRLKQAVLNLLSNAVKYNSEQGSITVIARELGDDIKIEIIDTGAGIPEEKLEIMFSPFERLDADKTTIEGTGLGLALTKRLVEAMGGIVGVSSKLGRGSTFWIELPRTEGQIEHVEKLLDTEPIDITSDNGDHRQVLYIEDNLANMQLVERLFADRPGIELMSSMQGALGLELAQEHIPDLILLDLNLPDISGDEVLIRLHADARTRDIPVVMITADATPGQARRLLQAGARDYLTKPIDVSKFFEVVDEALQEVGA